MTLENKPLDPEREKIKDKLKIVGITLAIATVVLPIGLPGWLSITIISICTIGSWYAVLKRKEAKQKVKAKL